jgi:archaellum component FlaC
MNNEEKILSLLEGMNGRLDGIDNRLDGMDKRFDRVESRLDGIDNRLDGMDKRFDRVEVRLGKLEHGQEDMKEDLEIIKEDGEATRYVTNLLLEFATVKDKSTLDEIIHNQAVLDSLKNIPRP